MEEKSTFDKIYDVIRQIPEGSVASYGQIAELAGNRRWARVVGYALHAAPCGSDLPCHRVVAKDGRMPCAFGVRKCRRQTELLKAEGIELVGDHIDMEKYQWKKKTFQGNN